ncbi:MAG: hypothetical protein J0H57_04250, partial [Rhodospirillales bacterium]|nr:hypothetical protein [Rhodospirillales bacterium]
MPVGMAGTVAGHDGRSWPGHRPPLVMAGLDPAIPGGTVPVAAGSPLQVSRRLASCLLHRRFRRRIAG